MTSCSFESLRAFVRSPTTNQDNTPGELQALFLEESVPFSLRKH